MFVPLSPQTTTPVSLTMSNTTGSGHSTRGEVIPSGHEVATKINGSLQLVMGWQAAKIPSRFMIGGGSLRKLALRLREQPTNFMIILHQSLNTAKKGQSVCRQGSTASRVLLGEENQPEHDITRYTTEMFKRVEQFATDERASGIYRKFRLLRTYVLEIHRDLSTRNQNRDKLSRELGEVALSKVDEDLAAIENSLNLIIRLWLDVENNLHHLQRNRDLSPQNRIALTEMRDNFATLGRFFEEYQTTSHQMSILYDSNIGNLNADDQNHVRKVQDCTNLVISEKGRLEAKRG